MWKQIEIQGSQGDSLTGSVSPNFTGGICTQKLKVRYIYFIIIY